MGSLIPSQASEQKNSRKRGHGSYEKDKLYCHWRRIYHARFPEGGYEGFEAVRDCIMQHDVKFSNLEMTFHDHEGIRPPFPAAPGPWRIPGPGRYEVLGFNLYNTANNHSHDYSHGAFWPPSSIYGNGI